MRRRPRRWFRRVFFAILALAGAVGVVFFVSTGNGAAFGAAPTGARFLTMQASKQHQNGVFVNARPTHVMGLSESGSVLEELLFGDQERTPAKALPVVTSVGVNVARAPESGLRLTWLGHSTMLIEIDGVRLLTDPVFGERASPSTLVGPARFHPVPASVAELGRIDAVLISHDHYDHLDMPTILELKKSAARFFVPLGVGAHLERWDVSPARIAEHDWWQESVLQGVRLIATPAQHFSGRGLLDRDRTLWASWTIVGPKHRVYFSGDTGLMREFGEIGSKYGPLDVAMLEVGAYHPKWSDIHLGPNQALEAFSALRAKRLLPVHWGTFNLAFHAWLEPAETLYEAARAKGVALLTPRVGQSVEPMRSVKLEPWWRAF
jgi:L-ascorbate metabolism protein UlaG (beta-lactamase superfamily)